MSLHWREKTAEKILEGRLFTGWKKKKKDANGKRHKESESRGKKACGKRKNGRGCFTKKKKGWGRNATGGVQLCRGGEKK